MLKGIKIRLYPNKKKEIYINKLIGSYRFVYNQCLNLKIKEYTINKKSTGLKELGNYFHQDLIKQPEYEFLKEHNTKVLKQSIITLLDSYKRFFVNGNGFPKFKSKHSNNQSVRFPADAISSKNDYLTNRLTLTKELKNIKFKCSKKYKNILSESIIKSATLSKTKSNKYYLSFLLEINEIKDIKKPLNEFIGLDLGIKDFIVDSNGNRIKNIKSIRNNEKKLKKLNQRLSKKQKGSKNKEKQRIKLSKYHEKLNNIKENYLHLVSNQIINENQVIIIEDLNVSGMMKNKNLSKSIQELSLNRFKNLIDYKSKWYGRDFVLIDRFFPSSKLCSCCGFKNDELKLSQREWTCSSCNSLLDRDLNAAINIRNEGIKLYKIGHRLPELKPLEKNSLESSVN
jgi:putative transposase